MWLGAPKATRIATPPWGAAFRAQGDAALFARCDPHVKESVKAMIGQSSFESERHTAAYCFTTCCCPTPPPPSLFLLNRTHTHGDPFEWRIINYCAIGATGSNRARISEPLWKGAPKSLRDWSAKAPIAQGFRSPPGRGFRNLCAIGALGLQRKDFGAPLFRSACGP
jgi:hypothetical protein